MISTARPTGADYLRLVTRLLQDRRIAHPTAGLWEAADLQWWWRRGRHEDPDDALFVLDDGRPVAAAVFTNWRTSHGVDVLGDPSHDQLWDFVASRHPDRPFDMLVGDDDEVLVARALQAGFTATDAFDHTGWLPAGRCPPVAPLTDGYRITHYESGPHPMAPRNGEDIAERLAECSLYRRELDLQVRAGDEVAGYALFWADPVTGVGLVEPMRVEDEHGGRGLARRLLTEGMNRLVGQGCSRLKVSWNPANELARRLYEGAGFVAQSRAHTFTRTPAEERPGRSAPAAR